MGPFAASGGGRGIEGGPTMKRLAILIRAMLRALVFAPLCVSAPLCLSSPDLANAQPAFDRSYCGGQFAPDVQISACTTIIQSGEPQLNRAIAYANRGA